MNKKKTITLILITIFFLNSFAQSNKKESWSFGIGLSNHTMAGDHRSIGTSKSNGADDNSPINLGGYIYVDKMFNPAFGLELKAHYTTMSGAAQEITNGYLLPDTGNSFELRDTHFDGTAYGMEISTIINFSNLAARPYRTKERKWNLAGYLGMGIQNYDSKLYDNSTGNVLVDFGNDNPSKDGMANSVYYTAAFGIKYKISNKLDIEFRPSVNLNEEDHLDAARSSKQSMEVFYQTNLGLVFKLNDKEHDNYVWQSDFVEEKKIEEKPDFEKMVDAAVVAKLKDYPMVDLDRDTDKDGFKDHEDACPLRYSKTNNGCPGDSDNDGVPDDLDLCPKTPGQINNNGCDRGTMTPPPTTVVSNSVAILNKHIYFDLDSATLTEEAKDKLNAIAIYMIDNPGAQFTLSGNTDKGGPEIYNQNLSKRRANAAMKYMTARGVNKDNLTIIANGESAPKFEAKTINRLNRRVDIMLK